MEKIIEFINSYRKMIDTSVKLFNGEMTYEDLINMDIEDYKDIVEIRAQQRKESIERYTKTGERDIYVDQSDSNELFMQMMFSMMGGGGFDERDMRPLSLRRQSNKYKSAHNGGMTQKQLWNAIRSGDTGFINKNDYNR